MGDKRPKQGWIYFVEAEGLGAVKIGFAGNLITRLKALQCGSPVILNFVFGVYMPTNARQEERALHAAFARYRMHHEWFSIEGAHLFDAALEGYQQRGFLAVDSIPQEHIREQLARNTSWRDSHIEQAREKERKRYASDPEYHKARHNAWYAANREHVRAYARARAAKKREQNT